MNFDFDTKEVTAEWLTGILIKNGFLDAGEIKTIDQSVPDLPLGAFISDFIAIDVKYSKGSEGARPSKILLKTLKPRFVKSEAHRELNFYNAVFDIQSELPILTCYGTEVCEETYQYCLLLEDLTATHHQPPKPIPPFQDECEDAIKTLATIHGYWWNHPSLGQSPFIRPSKERLLTFFNLCQNAYPSFHDMLGDRLPNKRREIFQLIFDKMPEFIWSRIRAPEKQTVVHGDAHFWNFLYPNDKKVDRCVALDWQGWEIGIVAKDLAYMMAFQWFPERRERLELSLLEYYLSETQKRDILIDKNDLMLDYRACAIMNLLLPVLWSSFDYHPRIWWHNLENAFSAFDDLDCVEFL